MDPPLLHQNEIASMFITTDVQGLICATQWSVFALGHIRCLFIGKLFGFFLAGGIQRAGRSMSIHPSCIKLK
jgi:hypothetical protein